MLRTRRTQTLSNLFLALLLAVGASWATRGPSPLQQPQARLIGRWMIVAQVTAAWGAPVPELVRPDPTATAGRPEVIEFFGDRSMRRYLVSPEHARALRGMYALRESGEFTMELSRREELARTIHFTGDVHFEPDGAQIRGRLSDETSGLDVHIAYLIQPMR